MALSDVPSISETNRIDSVPIPLGTSYPQAESHFNELEIGSRELVLSAKNVCKSYMDGDPVLCNLCMNVRRGTIYSLLGSSGCGKTTLLNCVVGLSDWDSGDILLFNRRPTGSPGRKVGFMPQDTALYEQNTIPEMMYYYGQLYGMKKSEIKEKCVWLQDFLQLPLNFQIIKNLSGGQRRRASLALCLIHSPQLLILDEPTVGLDPILRESIWQHLSELVTVHQTTVLITTHYFEETRLSNTIGVMRNGRLLVEDNPNALLRMYECDLLEDIVLRLCHTDERLLIDNLNSSDVDVRGAFYEGFDITENEFSNSTVLTRTIACSTVIWIFFWRYRTFMVLLLFAPSLQILFTLSILGTKPRNLKFGVVNEEMLRYDECFDGVGENDANYTSDNNSCNLNSLSCRFIDELHRTTLISLIPLRTTDEALKMIHSGQIRGYFHFPPNFSRHLTDFFVYKQFSTNETLELSRVRVTMDWTHYMHNVFVTLETREAYFNFAKMLATSCKINPRETEIPLEFRDTIFENQSITMQDYFLPVLVITVLFQVPLIMTPVIFINDKRQGTMDRARVAGLQFREIMMAHLITEGSVIISQTIICFLVISLVVKFKVSGSIFLYFVFCILGGLCGESFGLLVGVLCNNVLEAFVVGIFFVPCLFYLTGVFWPVVMMSRPVRIVSYITPLTLIVDSIRAVVFKGMGLTHSLVWPGVAVVSAWTVLLWALSAFLFLRKQKFQ